MFTFGHRGERIVFRPPNTNTNIFDSRIKTEYKYESIRFENINGIRIWIYSKTKIFEYIWIFSNTFDADIEDYDDNS